MKNLFLISILMMVFSGGINGQSRDDFKRWHFGLSGSFGMGSMYVSNYTANFVWHQGGVNTQYMIWPVLGVETGALFTKTHPTVSMEQLVMPVNRTYFLDIKTNYIDIPLNLVFKPQYKDKNKKVSFTINGGFQLNIPLVEKGRLFNSQIFADPELAELKTGNPSEVRLYTCFMPGWDFRFWEHTGMFIRFKLVIDPEITTNSSDFNYNHFFGLSFGLNS